MVDLDLTCSSDETACIFDYNHKNCKILPKALENKIDLQELYVRHNYIKRVPPWISKLVNLTDLSIYNNCLTTLPDEIGLLANLKSLDVGRNYLYKLPKSFKYLKSLNFLALENNCLAEIPEEIGYLDQLIVLQLSNNRVRKIPFTIVFCKSLFAIHLERNMLRSVPDNLAFLPNIEFLTVRKNKLLYLPSMPFTKKVHLDFSHNCYVNYVSFNFYEQQIACDLCDRWFCHRNHESVMAFRKGIKVFDSSRLRNIILEIKLENRKKRIIMNRMYLDIHKMEDDHVPTLLELSLRAAFETTTAKELSDMYFCAKENIPDVPTSLIKTLIEGPISKCQYCNNFIFTESVVWIVPRIVHCIICIKMDKPVVTIVNFCSSACAYVFNNYDWSQNNANRVTSLKIPWKRIN